MHFIGAAAIRMARFAALALALLLPVTLSPAPAGADTPGDFDFYVLSLSWSPTYCADEGRNDRFQCGGRPFAFVAHGLWPQFERGYPRGCESPQGDGVPRSTVDAMLDIMPSPGLVRHEWREHGTCSGLRQSAYFDLVRRAFDRVAIPTRFVDVDDYLTVSPGDVEAAFRRSNPGLPASGIAVFCDSRRLKEVRICMTRDLSFRPCPEIDRRACSRDRLVMPPVR